MSVIKGVVAAMSDKYDKWSICVDGNDGRGEQWYSSKFEIKAIQGDLVEFDSGPEGKKYCSKLVNLGGGQAGNTAAAAPAGGGKTPAKQYGNKGGFPIEQRDGQRSIIRQNALTNANALVASQGLTKVDADGLIAIARKLEAYSAGDIEMKRVKAKQEELKTAAAEKAVADAAEVVAAAEAARKAAMESAASSSQDEEPFAPPEDDDPFADAFADQ